jgi:vitamin B12 transporter
LSAGVCSLVVLQSALAQTPASMDTVVISGTRVEQRLADVLPHMTVITRGDIEQQQTPDLVDLLGRQAGIEFARNGGPGAVSSLFVRGTGSSQVLVLVDGVRLNTALSGAAALGAISIDTIERIEIVRGNYSSVYGSEAIGGVVQIFTRGGQKNSLAGAAEAGSGKTYSGYGSGTAVWESGRIAATVAARTTQPFSSIDAARTNVVISPFALGANPDDDRHRGTSAALRVEQRAGQRFAVRGSVWTNHNETDFDNTADGETATHVQRARQQVGQLETRWQASDAWAVRLTLSEGRDKTRNTSSVPFSFDNATLEARNRQATLLNEVHVTDRMTATLGAEWLEQRGGATSYDPTFANAFTSFARWVRAGWVGLNGSGAGHHVQLNVRRDDYSDIGDATTGLLAYGYDFAPGWRVSAQGSTAFRAPSFNDLYFPFFGNPQLRPERAKSAELGVRYGAGPHTARLALFRTLTRDLIAFDPTTMLAANIARARMQGVELVALTQVAGVRIDAKATYIDAFDAVTGLRLLRRAPYALHLGLARDVGPVTLAGEVSNVGKRYDSDINTFTRTELAPYTLLRLTAGWQINRALRATLRLENALDEKYELVSGYNTLRRSVFAGVSARL